MLLDYAFRAVGALLLAGTFLLSCPSCPSAEGTSSATILLLNKSHSDLVCVRFLKAGNASVLRLDLSPGDEEDIENPGGTVDLRLDFGLSLCTWPKLALDGLKKITLCPEHKGCAVFEDSKGKSEHVKGECASLLPAPGSLPVCSLEKFHTGMTMSDACGLIKEPIAADDSAYIATLGYAGLVWSARLYADEDSSGVAVQGGKGLRKDISKAALENIELRQVLTRENLDMLLAELRKQGYAPWQADFPGINMNFVEMSHFTAKEREDILASFIATYLSKGKGEATLMFAPSQILPELATADSPAKDVQLFTVLLRKESGTLVLDMAAYRGDEIHE